MGIQNVYRARWGDGNYVADYTINALLRWKNPHLPKNVHLKKIKSQFNLSFLVLVNFGNYKTWHFMNVSIAIFLIAVNKVKVGNFKIIYIKNSSYYDVSPIDSPVEPDKRFF